MSTFISEPGTRLGGRYRLEDRIAAGTGWSVWKAIDEILARPVTVLTFVPDFPRIREVVTAARAASRLTDARVSQVFDVEEEWDHAYVVMEWVVGDSLGDLLADGPLDPAEAVRIVAEAAEALTSAHAAGVAHLCLAPSSLRLTHGGGVKVTGIGTNAVLSGVTADDPALADTAGLGQLLYLALTAHSPGQDWPGFPPAPVVDGHLPTPRQVQAGVPAAVDDIVRQALLPAGGGSAITTPAALAAALARVLPARVGPPLSALAPPRGYGRQQPDPAFEPARWDDGRQRPPGRPRAGAGGERPFATRLMVSVVVVLVLAAAGIGALMLGQRDKPSGGGGAPQHRASASPSTGGAGVLTPVGASGFDPLTPPADDTGNENSDMAKNAIDSNPRTAWQTQYYVNNPRFGGLKAGTGLILDMGRPVKLSSLVVTFGSIPGANVRIELGNSAVRAPATLSSFTTVARASDVSGATTFTVHSAATGRYVLIWFTKLPPKAGSPGKYMAQVFNVIVRGST